MRLSKLNLSKFLPAAIALTTLSASSAFAFTNHHPTQPTAPHPQGVTSLAPALCNISGSGLIGDAAAGFVNIASPEPGLRNRGAQDLALELETFDLNVANGDLPYGYIKSSASPAYVDLQFDVFGDGVTDGSAGLYVTVVDSTTTLPNAAFIPLDLLPLAGTQPTHSDFETLDASFNFLVNGGYFAISTPGGGSLFFNAAVFQDNQFEDTLYMQNVLLNGGHGVPFATSILVAPAGNDCSAILGF